MKTFLAILGVITSLGFINQMIKFIDNVNRSRENEYGSDIVALVLLGIISFLFFYYSSKPKKTKVQKPENTNNKNSNTIKKVFSEVKETKENFPKSIQENRVEEKNKTTYEPTDKITKTKNSNTSNDDDVNYSKLDIDEIRTNKLYYPIFLDSDKFKENIEKSINEDIEELIDRVKSLKKPSIPKIPEFKSIISIDDDREEYNKNVEKYRSEYFKIQTNYERSVFKYNKERNKLLKEEEIEKERFRLLKMKLGIILKSNILPTRTSDYPKKNKVELDFLTYLIKRFGDEIEINHKVGKYYPMFIYKNQETDMYIDIEVDSMFNNNTKEPIHYINSTDTEMNDYFLANNWAVIRFAEEQVLNMPEECCNFIEFIVNNMLRKKQKTISESKLKKVKRWTYEESYLVANLYHDTSYGKSN